MSATAVSARLGWLLLTTLLVVSPAAAQSARKAVLIDTDPGTDDAMALLLAFNSPELDIRGLTVVPGNVTGEQAFENALRIASLFGRCDVPIALGARRPLAQKLITAEFVHGRNGLADLDLPPSKCEADRRFGPDLIIDLVRQSPGQITLVPIGPLTNIALAVLEDPGIVSLVKEVVIMGGSITEGNVTAVAEANIYNDPEAAQIVFDAGWKVTMVGLDVTHKTLFTRAHLEKLAIGRGAKAGFATAVMRFLVNLSEKFGQTGTPMHDMLAMGVAIDPGFVEVRHMRVDVETRGQFTRGATVGNRYNAVEHNELQGDRYVMTGIDRVEPNVWVAVGGDPERFIQFFIARATGTD